MTMRVSRGLAGTARCSVNLGSSSVGFDLHPWAKATASRPVPVGVKRYSQPAAPPSGNPRGPGHSYKMRETMQLSKDHGFAYDEVWALWHMVAARLKGNWSARKIADLLRHYREWCADPSTIADTPSLKYARANVSRLQTYDKLVHGMIWQEMGDHTPEEIAAVLSDIGYSSVISQSNLEQVRVGLYCLELAVELGNLEAATWLLKFTHDPGTLDLPGRPDSNLARAILAKAAAQQDCPWQSLVVYSEDQTGLSTLQKMPVNRVSEMIALLQRAASQITVGHPEGTIFPWTRFPNPWKILFRVADVCLKRGKDVPDHDLRVIRADCVKRLTEYHDPDACFETAMSHRFGSPKWVELMQYAPTDAWPDACWLFAVYRFGDHLQESSILTRWRRPPRDDEAYACALRCLQNMQDAPQRFCTRAVQTAAIARLLGKDEKGLEALQIANSRLPTLVKSKSFDDRRKMIGEMQEHLNDYQVQNGSAVYEKNKAAFWDEEKCNRFIGNYQTVVDSAISVAKQRLQQTQVR